MGWNTAADTNHEAELDRRECNDHAGYNSRCLIGADLAIRQTDYDNVVIMDGSSGIRVVVIWWVV